MHIVFFLPSCAILVFCLCFCTLLTSEITNRCHCSGLGATENIIFYRVLNFQLADLLSESWINRAANRALNKSDVVLSNFPCGTVQ